MPDNFAQFNIHAEGGSYNPGSRLPEVLNGATCMFQGDSYTVFISKDTAVMTLTLRRDPSVVIAFKAEELTGSGTIAFGSLALRVAETRQKLLFQINMFADKDKDYSPPKTDEAEI